MHAIIIWTLELLVLGILLFLAYSFGFNNGYESHKNEQKYINWQKAKDRGTIHGQKK